jgi:hypothetical protein
MGILMKTLLLTFTLLFNASNSLAFHYEVTDENPVIKDTVFTGSANTMGDILGHTYALLSARSKAKKRMMANCKEVHVYRPTRCKKHLEIKEFHAKSSSETECGGSLTPTCVFAVANYIGETSRKEQIINILLTKKVSEARFDSCTLIKNYGRYRITGLRLVTKVFGAVTNPKINVKTLSLISFDSLLPHSKFIDESPRKLVSSVKVDEVQGYSDDQICDLLKEKALNSRENSKAHFEYEFDKAESYRRVSYQ